MIKIMTLNLNYYVDKHGPWPARKQLIKDAISQANPDIIAFQAVAKDPGQENGTDQVRQLSQLLSDYSHHVFQAATTYDNGREEGMAILSRFKISDFTFTRLSLREGTDDQSKRILLRAKFELPSGPFYLFNGHFSWVYEQAQDNINEALPVINDVNGPALLVGDFNTTPDVDLLDNLRKNGWEDVWNKLHPGEDGFTYESINPSIRIDYAWANAQLKDKVTAIDIVQKEQNREVRLSDHLGLVTTLSLEG
jgi:endonuclease/exonuclease/phosphatase family metal-dependent hydrolase